MEPEIKIKCKEGDVPQTITRKEFLRSFLAKRPSTYFLNGREQASSKTHRSFTDLLAITKNRFPRTSLQAIIRIIAQINIEGGCDVIWCTQIKKFVVRGGYSNPGIPFVTKYSIKYFEDKVGEDGISFKTLMKIREEQNIK
mgnify:CR=1 FL=1|tara:strand:- start:10421 stop:10843 length:423 start_codon:yes stop_codon:yes gene_type:complete